ncbi:hypothetical protein EDB84DRAFT_1492937 [Lactarius hengduanensis]|nr:hypothetical protein EDB84DRAFT_1492937 [Lactarius hengduanensis]
MPIPSEVVSTARDSTGLLPPWQPRSPAWPTGGVCKAPAHSKTTSRPACTALAARPRVQGRSVRAELEPTRTSSEVPSRSSSPAPVFPYATSTTGASTSARSFSALPCGPNSDPRRRLSYNVLAMRSVTRPARSGCRREAGAAVEHGEARRGGDGTPTKMGSARCVTRARTGMARKSSKNAHDNAGHMNARRAAPRRRQAVSAPTVHASSGATTAADLKIELSHAIFGSVDRNANQREFSE